MDVVMRVLLVLWVTALIAACQPSGTIGTGESEARGSQTLDILQQKTTLQCESGREWWREKGQPKRGGAFIFASTGPRVLESLQANPRQTSSGSAPQVYRHLVQPRSCYYEDLVMEPDMVKSWQVSADGRTWTLKLREDIKWHNKPPVNGRAFTSADVAFTIEWQIRRGELRSFWEQIDLTTPDPHTVILRLPEPDPDFLAATLGERNLLMKPREVYEQHGDWKSVAIGTGPFMLKQFSAGVSSVMERNPDWPDIGADGKRLPYIDEIRVTGIGDVSAEVAGIRSGQVDRNSTQGVKKLDADALLRANPRLKQYTDTAACVWGLYFNSQKPLFNDVRVRKALQLAMNLDDLLASYHGGGVPTGYVPSAVLQYGWSAEEVYKRFKFDPERAKQLLAEAGYAPGDLKLLMLGGTSYTTQNEVALQMLRTFGLQVTLDMPFSSSSDLYKEKEWDLIWGAHSPCSYSVNRWMYSGMIAGGSLNVSGVSDARIDALAVAQAKELDPTKRKQLLDQMQDRLYELMAFVPETHQIYYRFDSCRVRNMRATDQHQHVTGIEHAWLDESGC